MITNFKMFENIGSKDLLDHIYNFLKRCDIEDDNIKISMLRDIPKYSDRIFISYKTGYSKNDHTLYDQSLGYRDTISVHDDKWFDSKNVKISFTCLNMDGFIKKIIYFLIDKISKINKIEINKKFDSYFYDYYSIKFSYDNYEDIVKFFDELSEEELNAYINMEKYNL